MFSKILTVIIPVYNKENLIRECLDSFINNAFKDTLEVLVIDDGSTDGSYDIIMEYVQKHPDIFCPVRKQNGGVGSVINMGLKRARGKYVKEVDADDWVDAQALERLLAFLKGSSVDIVLNPFRDVGSQGNYLKEHYFKGFYFGRVYPVEEVINKALFSIQSVTIRKELLDEHQFILEEDRYYIDMQLVDTSVLYGETCVFLSDSLYRYRKQQEDQSVSISSYIKNRKSFYSQTMLSFDRLRYIQKYPELNNKSIYLKSHAEAYSLYLYAIYLLCGEQTKDIEIFDAFIYNENKSIYIILNKYQCVRYIRKWNFIPHTAKSLLFSKRLKRFCENNSKMPEISDVRYLT